MLTGHWELGTGVFCMYTLCSLLNSGQTELFGGPNLRKLRFSGLG